MNYKNNLLLCSWLLQIATTVVCICYKIRSFVPSSVKVRRLFSNSSSKGYQKMFALVNLIALSTTGLIFFNLNLNKANAENHTWPNISYTKMMRTNEFENNNNMLVSCIANVLEEAALNIHGDIIVLTRGSNGSVQSIIGDLVDRVFQHDFMIPTYLTTSGKLHGYIFWRLMFIDSFESHVKLLREISVNPMAKNSKISFLVVLMVPDHTAAAPTTEMQKIFQPFRMYNFFDVNIMVATTKRVETYTFYPYAYEQYGSTRPILLHTCSRSRQTFHRLSFFPRKNQNLNLSPFYTLTAHLPPFIILKKPFMNAESLTGIDGEILKVLSRKMNFTIVLKDHSADIGATVYENGSATGVYEILNQRAANLALGYSECIPNRMRYFASTKSYYQTSYRIILKNSEGYSSLETVFFPFSTQTWIMLLIVNIIRIILLTLKHYKYFKCLSKTVPNMIFLAWCFIALTFRSFYESLFYKIMLNQPSKPLPTSFDELRQQNYKILTDIISSETAQNISELNGMLVIADTTPYEVLREFEDSPSNKLGVLTNMDTFSYFVKNSSEKLNKYVNLKVRLMDQMFCMYFPYLSDFTDEFNLRVTQLHTFGLLAQIAQKFTKPIILFSSKDYHTRRDNETSSDKILSLYHLKGPLIIFVCLQAIACGVFTLELLSFKLKWLARAFSIFTK